MIPAWIYFWLFIEVFILTVLAALPDYDSMYAMQMRNVHCKFSDYTQLKSAPKLIEQGFDCTDNFIHKEILLYVFSSEHTLVEQKRNYCYNKSLNGGLIFFDDIVFPFEIEYSKGITDLKVTIEDTLGYPCCPHITERADKIAFQVYSDFKASLTCIAIPGDNTPLPPIQIDPTPQNPFVHLHVDKTAGTKLRK